MPWDFALILIVLGVLVPWRGAVRIKKLLGREHLSTADRLVLYASTIAFQWVAVAAVAWRCHVRGLNAQRLALVYSDASLTIITAVTLSFFLGATQIFSLRRLARSPAHRQKHLPHLAQLVMPHNMIEALAFVALVSTVALCEEYLYRGLSGPPRLAHDVYCRHTLRRSPHRHRKSRAFDRRTLCHRSRSRARRPKNPPHAARTTGYNSTQAVGGGFAVRPLTA